MVRRPWLATGSVAGTASSGSGGAAMPPRAARSASRLRHCSTCACDGASPAVPIKEPSGIRTPGSSFEVAQPSLISQWTRYGSVNRSLKKPEPGRIRVHPCGWGRMSTYSTSSRSPGLAPFTYTGPVSGCPTLASIPSRSVTDMPGRICPSEASRVSRSTYSPGSASNTGGMSGCHLLCPVCDSCLRRLVRSISMLFKPLASFRPRCCLTSLRVSSRFRKQNSSNAPGFLAGSVGPVGGHVLHGIE